MLAERLDLAMMTMMDGAKDSTEEMQYLHNVRFKSLETWTVN